MTEHTNGTMALSPRRVAIHISNADSRLAANQRAALQRYADNMDWMVTVIEDDRQRLLEGAAACRTGAGTADGRPAGYGTAPKPPEPRHV